MRVRHDAPRSPRFGPTLRQPFGAATVLADTLCAVLADTTQTACRRYTRLSGRFADALLADAIYTVLVDATQDSLGGLPTLHKILCLRTLSIVC